MGKLQETCGVSVRAVRPVARGWLVCLQAIAATTALLEEAQRLTWENKGTDPA